MAGRTRSSRVRRRPTSSARSTPSRLLSARPSPPCGQASSSGSRTRYASLRAARVRTATHCPHRACPHRSRQALEVDSKAAAFSKAAGEPETVAAFEAVVDEWCDQTEALIEEKDTDRMVRLPRPPAAHDGRLPLSFPPLSPPPCRSLTTRVPKQSLNTGATGMPSSRASPNR